MAAAAAAMNSPPPSTMRAASIPPSGRSIATNAGFAASGRARPTRSATSFIAPVAPGRFTTTFMATTMPTRPATASRRSGFALANMSRSASRTRRCAPFASSPCRMSRELSNESSLIAELQGTGRLAGLACMLLVQNLEPILVFAGRQRVLTHWRADRRPCLARLVDRDDAPADIRDIDIEWRQLIAIDVEHDDIGGAEISAMHDDHALLHR